MNQKIAHISRTDLNDLMQRYYAGEKTSDLIAEFGIDVRSNALVSLFPPLVHEDKECPFCEGEKLVQKRTHRGSYRSSPPTCPKCRHEHGRGCACKNCRAREAALKQDVAAKKQEIISRRYQRVSHDYPLAHEFTLKDAVYLLALFRHSADEEIRFAYPFSDKPPPLAPTFDLTKEIVQHLYAKYLIAPSAHSAPDAFDFNEDMSDTTAYYFTHVLWEFLPGMDLHEKHELLESLRSVVNSEARPEEWRENMNPLWRLIAKHECIEYFEYLLSQRDFELESIGPKTHSVFDGMLQNFSVAQVNNLSWQAVRDATDYMVRENLPRYRAKNNFIGAIQRKADKFIAEGWEVRCSRRDFNCPQSVLSSTFFDVFSGHGADAFITIPGK